MQRLNSKEYGAIAELMRGFLEEIELMPYDDLPNVKTIITALKRYKYVENGITAQQLDCTTDGVQVVFVQFDKSKSLDELFKPIMNKPLEAGNPIQCYIVVFVKTIAEKNEVDALKTKINALAKKWLANRTAEKKRSKVQFCTLHNPMSNEKDFSISINSRIRSLHYEPESEAEETGKIMSDVYIANLFDIVNLYDQIGTELFLSNVRYHIRDVLNVESEIQNTLNVRPADFFNSNNGIAIQIKNCGNLDRRNERDIRLTYSKKGDLSVINGAQTISAAADFFFQVVEGENEEATQKVIENAKQKAWVLLRVFYPSEKTKACCTSVFDQISISLNRQKPITPMDVSYSRPEVMLINSLYENHRENQYYFKILKRGQDEFGRFQYQLSDFGRMVTAYYYNNPGAARSSSTQDIIQYSSSFEEYEMLENDESNDTKSIYAPFADSEDNNALFMSWYRPMNFAFKIASLYIRVDKEYRNLKETERDANIMAILGNGRYFFVAYIVNMLNGGNSPEQSPHSFADFPYAADDVKAAESDLQRLIKQYAEYVAKFAETYLMGKDKERNTLNSNDFKTRIFYEAWCKHASNDDTVCNWNKSIMAALNSRKNSAESQTSNG